MKLLKVIAVCAVIMAPVAVGVGLTRAQLNEAERSREALEALVAEAVKLRMENDHPTVELVDFLLPDGRVIAVDPAVLNTVDDWQVRCPSVDGGAAQSLIVDIDGGIHLSESYSVENGTSTCVAIGGDNVASNSGGGTGSTRGGSVGSGCASGPAFAIEARGGKCRSRGAAQVVNVVGGRQ